MSRAHLLGSELPLAAAPMAGGPTSVELVAAVSASGAFAFLAGGYKSPQELASQISELTALGGTFGVNLFVPERRAVDAVAFAAYAAQLQPEADPYGLQLDPHPVDDDDNHREKLALLVADPVPVVSFTFGLPSAGDVTRLRRAGSVVLATVTNAAEARAARDVRVDGLIVQGAAAGGHSATHDPSRNPEPIGTADLTRRVLATAGLPVLATGGVSVPRDVTELIDAGADAVAIGTLLLLADEAGTSTTHRTALAEASRETVLTRAFTGRPARALRNGFIDRHSATAPTAYPALHHLTRDLRRAAAAAGDVERLHLWAGTGYRHARAKPASEIILDLASGL